MNLELINKTALISGSTKGIGLAIASQLASEGARVIVNGRSDKAVHSALEQIRKQVPEAKVEGFGGDLSTEKVGFNAFWLRGTPNTLGILQDLGFIYHIDDVSRDEPFTVTVKGKPFAVVPYTIRNNDIVRFDSPATTNAAYLQDLKDDFDILYAEAATRRPNVPHETSSIQVLVTKHNKTHFHENTHKNSLGRRSARRHRSCSCGTLFQRGRHYGVRSLAAPRYRA